MARHGFLLLALALLLGVCVGSAVRAEPVGDAASSTTQSESTSAEEKEADVKSSSEAASNSQEEAEAVEKQPGAESKQSSEAASASAASQQSGETADSASEQSEEQPSASESASEEKTDEASASAASESASEEKTDGASASSEDQAQSQDKPATEGSSESSDENTDASHEKEDSDSSSSKEEESTEKKADAGATKLALGKTALPIAHPNGMPASVVNTAFGPTLGNAAHLNGKKYGIVGEGLNAHAVPMTDTFPSANGRVTINPVNPKLQQIAPAPVMGSGIGATPCSGAACSGMTTVPVGQKIVHDMTVTNVPGVPQAEVAVAAPGTPTMRQGKMTRTAGDVTLPPVLPAVPEGTEKLGLVSNSDGTSKLVVPSINGHLREVPGIASVIDPTIKDLGVYGNQTTGHFAGIAVPGPSHEDSQGDPEKDFSQTPVRSQGGRIVAVPDESLDGGAAALGVMGHGDNAKLVAIPDAEPSDLAQAAKAVSHEGSKYARTVYVPGAPSAAPMKDIPITMIGEKFFAIPGIKRDNGKTKMEVVGTGDNAHVVAVPDGDLTQAPQGFITNDSNAHVLALPSANGGNARVVTVGDTFADGTPVMGAGTTLAIMGERGSQRVVMLPKGGSDLAFAQNGSVAALPDHMQPGDPLSVFKMVTGSGDKGKMVAMPGTGLAAMHDGTELALVAEGKDARVVVVPKKQSNTFGRSGSITSILTAKYSLNSTRSMANKLEAEIKKEGLTEGPKFPLPDSLQGATVLGYGHKMSYTGMESISHFGSPSGLSLPLYDTATGAKVNGKTLTANGNGGQPILVDHGISAPINVQPVMLPSCMPMPSCSGSVPSVLGRSQTGPILMALLNYSVPIYDESGKAVPGLSVGGVEHSGSPVILNQPEQGVPPIVLGSARQPKFLYGIGPDGAPIVNVTGSKNADRQPKQAKLYATGPDGAMTIDMSNRDEAKGPDGLPVKYLGTTTGSNGEPIYHPVLNVRGHYGVDDLNRPKSYVARGHYSNGNPAFFDAKSGKELSAAYIFEKSKDSKGKAVYLNISSANDGGGSPIYVGKLPKTGEHQVYYTGKADSTGQAKGPVSFAVADPGPGNPRPDVPGSVPVLDLSDEPAVVDRFGQPTKYIGSPTAASPFVHTGTSLDGQKTVYDVSKLTGKAPDQAMKPTYFGPVGHVDVPPEQLADRYNETIPAYYTYVAGKQVPVFVNRGKNKHPVMISAKSGDHAGQSEILTHDSALYNPHNISMQMYYTEVDDGAGKKRKVPVTWSHPHFPHEGQDKIMQKVEVSFGSTKATMMKEVDAGTPTVVHPPKNLLDPSGGLVMNASDIPPPVTRPLAMSASDGSQIILPSTEAVESLRDGIRPLVTNEERQKFYNEALSPIAQKIMSPDRVQCLCDDFAAGEKVKCNCKSQPAPIMTADKHGCPKVVCPSCPIADVCPPCPKKSLQWKMFPRCPQCAPCKCKICPKCDKKCPSCPAFNPQIKCPSCDCTSPDFCKPKACATTPECSLCPLPNKTTYCAEKVEDPWFTKAMGKLSDREKVIAAAEAAMSKEQAKRKFRNDISALHRRAENEKTVLLLELDKQRKMLNDERFVNREKLDRRTFELFELKMKSREMFKEEWVAFEKKEKDRWAALNARQAANDEMEMRLRKEEVAIEADEDIVHMKSAKQEKELRESLKESLQGARMQVRNTLMQKKKDLSDSIKQRQKDAKALQKQLELEEMYLVRKEEDQKKREAAHSVFLTPRIQITPEDQPELTIKPWTNGKNGKTESQEGGVHSQSQN